jgi:soluble lytic murein transglycosylase-like protein
MSVIKRNLRHLPKVMILIAIVVIITIGVTYLLRQFSDVPPPKIEISSNPESVIPPYESPKSDVDYSGYFSTISKEPLTIITNYLYNWQNLFDIFAANSQMSYLKYNISQNTLEQLEQKIKKRQFFKGSSDEIIAEYGDVIKDESKYYKLDWRLILSMIRQESAFTSDAVSRAGAYGFMQIMPSTGITLEQRLNLEDHTSPTNNLIAGIYYYALLVGRYDGAEKLNKYKLALAAYNAGSGHVEDAMTITYYLGKDYLEWDNVADALTMLGADNDSLHIKIWNGRPPNGVFSNWKEPVNYVDNIMYYWEEYKRIYKP